MRDGVRRWGPSRLRGYRGKALAVLMCGRRRLAAREAGTRWHWCARLCGRGTGHGLRYRRRDGGQRRFRRRRSMSVHMSVAIIVLANGGLFGLLLASLGMRRRRSEGRHRGYGGRLGCCWRRGLRPIGRLARARGIRCRWSLLPLFMHVGQNDIRSALRVHVLQAPVITGSRLRRDIVRRSLPAPCLFHFLLYPFLRAFDRLLARTAIVA